MQKAAQEAEEAQGRLDSSQSLLAQREAALKDARQQLTQVQVCPWNVLHLKARRLLRLLITRKVSLGCNVKLTTAQCNTWICHMPSTAAC